jgi:hypothetical protein
LSCIVFNPPALFFPSTPNPWVDEADFRIDLYFVLENLKDSSDALVVVISTLLDFADVF